MEPGRSATIRRGNKQLSLNEFFYDNPPIIRFADGSSLEGNSLTMLKASYAPILQIGFACGTGRVSISRWSLKG
jgi:hypothetical protein